MPANNQEPVPLEGMKTRRTAAGVSLADIATAIGATRQHASYIEAGRSRCDLVTGRLIAERLGCKVDELF